MMMVRLQADMSTDRYTVTSERLGRDTSKSVAEPCLPGGRVAGRSLDEAAKCKAWFNNPKHSMGLPYMPISWGGARGINGAAYMAYMECLGMVVALVVKSMGLHVPLEEICTNVPFHNIVVVPGTSP